MNPITALSRLTAGIALAMFAVMFALTLAQVLFRYFLHLPVPWTEEAARALFVLATLSGIALAWRDRQHIIVDFLYLQSPLAARRWLSVVFALSILGFLALWARGALDLAQRNWTVRLVTIDWFRVAYYYIWELAMIALLAIYVLSDLRDLLTGRITGLQLPEAEDAP